MRSAQFFLTEWIMRSVSRLRASEKTAPGCLGLIYSVLVTAGSLAFCCVCVCVCVCVFACVWPAGYLWGISAHRLTPAHCSFTGNSLQRPVCISPCRLPDFPHCGRPFLVEITFSVTGDASPKCRPGSELTKATSAMESTSQPENVE